MAAEPPAAGDTNASNASGGSSSQGDLSESIKWQMELHVPTPTRGPGAHVFRHAFRNLKRSTSGGELHLSEDQVRAFFPLVADFGAVILRNNMSTDGSSGSSSSHTKKVTTDDDLRTVLVVQHAHGCPGPKADSFNKPPPPECQMGCERTVVNIMRSDSDAPMSSSTCGFCLESFAEDTAEWAQCSKCSVMTCKECYSAWLRVGITDARVGNNLTCGHCKEPVPKEDVLQYCGEVTAKRYTYFMLRHEHRDNPYALFCANDDCRSLLYSGEIKLIQASGKVHCADCKTTTCINCHQKEHTGECTTPAQGFGQFRNNMWEAIHAKRCPGCDVWIQRDGGCSNMRCTHCGITFCYRCRRPFIEGSGRAPRGDCMCSKANEAGMWLAVISCAVVVIPVGLAAAVVLGPPTAAVVAVLPKRKKQRLKSKWKNFWDSLKEEDY